MATNRTPAEPEEATTVAPAATDDALAKGYIGHVPDEHPNDAYALTTGPDAPPLVPDATTRAAQHTVPTSKES